MLTKPLYVSIALLFAGCVSPIAPGGMPKVAPNDSNKVTVYVFITTLGVKLFVNEVESGSIGRHDYTWFQMPPGIFNISMNDSWQKGRKLSARQINGKAGEVIFIKYETTGQSSDGQLIFEAVSGASKNQVNFRPENLVMIGEEDAKLLMKQFGLVGNSVK